ncbi:MAG TPA: YfiR family protein [Pseudomonadales bacterium]
MKHARFWHCWMRVVPMALLLTAPLWADTPAHAQSGPSEYDLKAAFVYQFLAYVTWPASKPPNGPLVIGVVGAGELADNLAALAAAGAAPVRPIDIRRLSVDADPRDLHVLFVADVFDDEADPLLRAAADAGVLTVTETLPRPPDAMINFEIVDNKVRFEVALGRARASGMDISARLLGVALRVVDTP